MSDPLPSNRSDEVKLAALRERQATLVELPAQAPNRLHLHEEVGHLLLGLARYDEASAAYRAMLQACTPDDGMALARAWINLSSVQSVQGDHHASLASARRAEGALNEVDGMGSELVDVLLRQGLALQRLGRSEEALPISEQAATLAERLNDPLLLARCANLLGQVHSALGHFAEGEQHKRAALALFEDLGETRWVGVMLANLGETARQRGDFGAALALYEQALRIAREENDRDGELVLLNNIGGALVGLGRYAEAEAHLHTFLSHPAAHDWFALGESLCFLGEACLGQGKLPEARQTAHRALKRAEETSSQGDQGRAWRLLGQVGAQLPDQPAEPDVPDPSRCFNESQRIFIERGMEAERARTLREWARYEVRQGHPQRATALWDKARTFFARLGMSHELARMQSGPDGKWYKD